VAGTSRNAGDDERSFYLPDFCESRAVLAIVLIAVLLGLVLTLARQSAQGEFWTDLARISMFLLWNGLLCAAVLCKARSWLAHRSARVATAIALGLLVLTVICVAEVVYWFGAVWSERLGIPVELFPQAHWSFVLPGSLIAAIVGAMALRYFYVANQWRRSVELEARSRVSALQARIRPHFLFNSMNTIASLTRSDPGRAEEAIEDLADLFRASLNESRGWITLREEIEIAQTYERIEQLRLGRRLRVDWRLDGLPLRVLVPSLLLQPLLENAIGHGIEPLPEGGVVEIVGSIGADQRLVIDITNPKASCARPVRAGHGMALDNIRERLELAYPGRSSVTVEDGPAQYRIRLEFPAMLAEGATAAA
jgi:two-component system sensor histidine kinase AlgZ